MNLIHTIPGMGLNSGGPTTCLYNLFLGLKQYETNVHILTYSARENDNLISFDKRIKTITRPKEQRYGWSRNYRRELKRLPDPDIIHANGLWQYTTHAAASFARQNDIPYLISPHGMLYPEALRKSNLFKKIAMLLYQRKDLSQATVIHVTCNQEMMYIREQGYQNRIAVIPNAIDINIPVKLSVYKNYKKRVGFVGRFAPIKNIENLINAWAESGKNRPDWELVLIGDGETSYKASLIKLAEDLGISNIVFTGFLQGEDKEKALQSLNYLVLPSKSENFGMVVPEALIREVPVIASKGTPWEELNSHQAGWWIDIGIEPLIFAIKEAISLSDDQRNQMGIKGRKLVEEKYSIEAVASQMIQLYKWILKEGEKPDFVFEN